MINHFLKIVLIVSSILATKCLTGQESLVVGGGMQLNGNVFLRDSAIGAAGIPQYDHQIYGGESWLDLNLGYAGFSGGLRFDLFSNSNLLNPQSSYSAHGIGKWYLQKSIDKLDLSVGYIYDQIGSGIIYRAYEERAQLIDNALVGAAAKWNFNSNWSLRGFMGKQRNLFETYKSQIKGLAINGFYSPSDTSSWSISPGIGFINRTLDESIVSELAAILGTYETIDQIKPFYNTNAISIFNNLSWRDISWYAEYALKPTDIFYDPNAIRSLPKGQSSLGKLVKGQGSVAYTSISYAAHNLGLTLEAKRTEGMDFRAEPLLSLNKGLINFIPPMAKINTYRLLALYYPATQFLNELAYQADLKYGWKNWNLSLNYSDIRDLKFEKQFYNEIYSELSYKKSGLYTITAGVQRQIFDVEKYYGKGGAATVKTITPFFEVLYKLSQSKSLRTEFQYMNNKTDIGSWVNGLVEFGMAPNWIFEVSDMYNLKPVKGTKLNYPSAGVTYSKGANRLSLRYVKQIAGIVCSGGICRLEPAFSGIRMSLNSNF
ncbi:MAG: hypothetical protein IPP01_09370 [Saprospiraceae bacterium]|nr:hypothetical protein [Saprospiraceae bacterium]